jgi:hypothetical protein
MLWWAGWNGGLLRPGSGLDSMANIDNGLATLRSARGEQSDGADTRFDPSRGPLYHLTAVATDHPHLLSAWQQIIR